MTEYRASFDADVTFLNGGGLQAQGFRLDVPDSKITEDAVAELFVEHLGLLMVDRVRIDGLQIIAEPHKGSRGGPAARAHQPTRSRLVELNHMIEEGMTTYPGLPGPEITEHLTREKSRELYEPGTEFAINRVSMVGNTGTYLDTPYHRFADGHDLADLPLERVADCEGMVIDVTGASGRAIDWQALAAGEVRGKAVLVRTGWDRHWRTDRYFENHPHLTEAAAEYLRDQGALLVGIDSLNIDDTSGGERPVHTVLLRAGIPIIEHMTGLERLPADGFRFSAVPPKVRRMGTFPVRAHAIVARRDPG